MVTIRDIQMKLKSLGYYTRAVDGINGIYTTSAIKAFQRSKKLVVDGYAGPITLKAMGFGTVPAPAPLPSAWQVVRSYSFDKQDTGYTCGPTSMSMGLTEMFPGTGSREAELARYAGTTTSGTGHEGLRTAFKRVLEMKGLAADSWEQDLSTMTAKQLGAHLANPEIIVICHGMTGGWKEGGWINNYGHYVYPIGVNTSTGQYKIADPTKGVITYSKAGFEAGLKMISQKSILMFSIRR